MFALAMAVICIPRIAVGAPYYSLPGDRVLLANDDLHEGAVVTGQGIDTTALGSGGPRWEPVPESYVAVTNEQSPYALYNLNRLKDGTLSDATEWYHRSGDDVRTWHLKDIRLGNVFDAEGKALGAAHNYLPWRTTTAMDYRDGTEALLTQHGAGQIVMRNRDTAQVVSPLYAEGIGRIYFDAVNFTVGVTNLLAVQVSAQDDGGDESAVDWTAVDPALVDVLAYTNGVYAAELSSFGASEIALGMELGGGTNNFYRIVLSDPRFVNYRAPARFRIVRLEARGEGAETEGMAVLDNIICSFPAMDAEIVPSGDYEPDRRGERVLGWAGSLEDPDDPGVLPYSGAMNLVPGAIIRSQTNSALSGASVTVSDAVFHYRWRYLSQQLLGGNCSATNSSESVATDQAKLSGAVLNLPTMDASFTNLAATVSAIWLGNTAEINASQIQYIGVKVGDREYKSQVLNGTGSGTSLGKYEDKSWKQRYSFETPFEVRMGANYPITFYDQYNMPITEAQTVRLVRDQELGAIRVNSVDLAKDGFNRSYNRLLGRVEYEYAGEFRTLPMTVGSDGETLKGSAPIDAAYTARPGDLEFYYSANIDAPYYEWVNYAGAGEGGIPAALEAPGAATTRRSVDEGWLPSRGYDYFARLRYGRSELRDFLVQVTNVSSGATAEFRTSRLVDDMDWHALVYARTNGTEKASGTNATCEVRFAEVDRAGVTNVLKITGWDIDQFERWPETLTATPATDPETAWIKIPFDGTTDFLRFRYLEGDNKIVVTRADFQNFNGWNDANRNEEIFVGQSTDESSIHGVSNAQIVRETDFGFWAETPETSALWQEPFTNRNLTVNVPFDGSVTTPNGWTAGPGQYVNRQYDVSGNTVALQMYGRGNGYLQLQPDNTYAPNGVKEVTLSARLAQTLNFKNFATFQADSDIGAGILLKNYSVSTRAVMGYLNEKHDGLSSMSLVANHNSELGCYEFRVTQVNANRLYRLELYRWNRDADGNFAAEQLGATEDTLTYNMDADAGASNFLFPAMYISVTNIVTTGTSPKPAVHVTAGVQKGGSASDYRLNAPASGKYFRNLIYNDTSDNRHTEGSFGVASVNCAGRFAQPTYYPQAATLSSDRFDWEDTIDKSNAYANFGSGGKQLYRSLLTKGRWNMGGWMQEYFQQGFLPESPELTPNWGVMCSTNVSQKLILSLADVGGSFEPVATNIVTGFALSTNYTFTVCNTTGRWVKLSVGGSGNDAIQTDVVVADVGISQWSGESYNSTRQYSSLPGSSTSYEFGAYTNIVFTECWVHGETNSAERAIEMNASRARFDGSVPKVQSVRSPLFDGGQETDGFKHGLGLGMVAFSYTGCDEHVNLLVQIATNTTSSTVDRGSFRNLTFDTNGWETVASFSGSAVGTGDLSEITPGIPLKHSGVASYYLGLHDVTGAVRVVMDPRVIRAAQTGDGLKDPAYGSIMIGSAVFRDEPGIDQSSWWGYNVRTGSFLRDSGDDMLQVLEDGSETDAAAFGMSVALNCSVEEKVDPTDTYTKHVPFVQTPTFAYLDTSDTSPEVGELTFQARRYDTADATARITIYGWKSGEMTENSNWTYLTHFDIDSDIYTNLTYRIPAGDQWRSFRLAVNGVAKAGQMGGAGNPDPPDPVVRVAFDNVMVSETINPRVQFANIMAFHSNLTTLDKLDYSDARSEQPLTEEPWGVQVEIKAFQLPEQIAWDQPMTVTLYWYEGKRPWGPSTNWTNRAVLSQCDNCAEGEYIFRSSYLDNADSVIPATLNRAQVVQYHLTVAYYVKSQDPASAPSRIVQELDPAGEWSIPEWYTGLNLMLLRGSGAADCAFTILDNVAPGNAWINEANVYGLMDDNSRPSTSPFFNSDFTNQYVEVAIPAHTDIEGWRLDFISMLGSTNTMVRFSNSTSGEGYAPAEKSLGAEDGFAFLSVASPATESAGTLDAGMGEVDGVWRMSSGMVSGDNTIMAKESLDGKTYEEVYNAVRYPLAVQLVRSSGVIEHQITLGGTNYYTTLPALAPQAPKYSASRLAETLNAEAAAAGRTSKWFAAGYDVPKDESKSLVNSLSVSNLCGEVAADWTPDIEKTPGRKNSGQVLPEVHVASGDSVVFYCYVGTNTADTVSGRLLQSGGAEAPTTDRLILVVPKNSAAGTNLVYTITNYYEIAAITTNGTAIAEAAGRRNSYNLNVGKEIPNGTSITLKAWVRPWPELATTYGLDEANRYTDAVLAWLEQGTLLGGTQFDNPGGNIELAQLIEYPNGTPQELSLSDMYCLDMDPTLDNQYLVAGIKTLNPKPDNSTEIDFYMAVSNDNDQTDFSPYTFRGATPGSNTQDASAVGSWSDFVLMLKGIQMNKYYDPTDEDHSRSEWVTLKWFVIDGASFGPDHLTRIVIEDQRQPGTPGYYEGWGDEEFKDDTFNFKWTLGDLDKPKSPTLLKDTITTP